MYHLGLQNQMTALASGINIALYDAIGKTHGLSVSQLLGGKGKERIPVYASGGYLTTTLTTSSRRSWSGSPTRAFPGPSSRSASAPSPTRSGSPWRGASSATTCCCWSTSTATIRSI